jgi:hypothetical protein
MVLDNADCRHYKPGRSHVTFDVCCEWPKRFHLKEALSPTPVFQVALEGFIE